MTESRYQDVGVGREPAEAASVPPQPVPAEARQWRSDHPVNLRLSLPLGLSRYYLTIVAGRERRSPARQRRERRKHPLWTFGNAVFLAMVGSVIGLALLALIQLVLGFVVQEAGMVVPRP